MKYDTLLFDVDDTLLDFKKAEDDALVKLFESEGVSDATLLTVQYKKLNQSLWKAFERGEISRDEVIQTRFAKLFAMHGQTVNGVLLENTYRGFLEEGHEKISGAAELLTQLAPHYALFVVTNGVSKTQYRRLRDSGLDIFFQKIFVSEDTGYQKPQTEFFDYCFARIPHFDKEKTLLIGDSLSSDIRGASLSGLDSCWFNPDHLTARQDEKPTYEIHALSELLNILS
ncbi:YjjG family noncanonical pyrimidine nucleotidase [Listeria fleischmannii]|uniref:Hydrolase n=2 Tax=Listeria fleischmannii FSL S10-1203 TaxID=1265822 RepID=W7DNJ5_9LIST|nr:YjjG family noncanonical pyrimidine nucleotidase [Listeria fleischmannii]EUJ59250.1 hydrolase [Listeria fleischmannii FSL S10-1203]